MSFQEEAYVEFLHRRRVPLIEREFSEDASDVVPEVSKKSFFSNLFFYYIVFD